MITIRPNKYYSNPGYKWRWTDNLSSESMAIAVGGLGLIICALTFAYAISDKNLPIKDNKPIYQARREAKQDIKTWVKVNNIDLERALTNDSYSDSIFTEYIKTQSKSPNK